MTLLCTLCDLYTLAIFGRIIFSWIPLSHDSPVAVVQRALTAVTEPVMGPLRRALPAVRMGHVGLDLSPILVLVLLQVVVKGILLGC
ncbi:MAG TPA: hypothetical protein DEP66_00410 [Acidimicrobiaceae bacterium]|nr:hypothetical protein [Acidimicrobiaceae bacterium]HCB36708.1 hypothetical protein [Acidimicrobiaceae bacterium]